MSPAAVEAILHDFANRATRLGAARADGSELWRFTVDGGHVYDLFFFPDDDTLIRRRIGGATAARQFTQLQALQKLGVPASRVIANLKGFRIGPDRKGDACIVVHDGGVVPLATHATQWAALPHEERLRVIADLYQRLEDLHRHRMCPRPLRTTSFGVREADESVRVIGATGPMSGMVDVDRLHELDGATRHLTSRSDRVRAWRHFTGDATLPRGDRKLAAHAERLAREALRGAGDEFGSIDLDDGWSGVFLRRLPFAAPWSGVNDLVIDADAWRTRVPTLLDPPAEGWTSMKDDAAARVSSGTLRFADEWSANDRRAVEVVVKRPLTPPGFGGWSRRLRTSRVRRAWFKTWRLLARGFACEVPLLMLERRAGPTWSDQLLVCERIAGPTLAKADLASLTFATRERLLGDCGRVLGRIERAGFTHLDAKGTNWIVWTDPAGTPRPVLIDLDGIRRVGPRGFGLKRLIRAMHQRGDATETDVAAIEAGFVRGGRG